MFQIMFTKRNFLFSYLSLLFSFYVVCVEKVKQKKFLLSIEDCPSDKTTEFINSLKDSGLNVIFYFSTKNLNKYPKEKTIQLIKNIHSAKMFIGLYLKDFKESSMKKMSKKEFQNMLKKEAKDVGIFLPGNIEPKLFTAPFKFTKEEKSWAKEIHMLAIQSNISKPVTIEDSQKVSDYYIDALSKAKEINKFILSFKVSDKKDYKDGLVLIENLKKEKIESNLFKKKVGFDKENSQDETEKEDNEKEDVGKEGVLAADDDHEKNENKQEQPEIQTSTENEEKSLGSCFLTKKTIVFLLSFLVFNCI